MHSTLSPRMVPDHTYLTQSTHSNLLRSHQHSWEGPVLLRKRTPDTIHNTSVDRSAGPYLVSLPRHPLKQCGQSQSSIDDQLLGLPVPYLWHAISTFNTCSQGSTHRYLTDTSGATTLEVSAFRNSLPDLPNRWCSTFYLRAPLDLSLSNLNISLKSNMIWSTYRWPVVSTKVCIYV
jgi:hypothetical protein